MTFRLKPRSHLWPASWLLITVTLGSCQRWGRANKERPQETRILPRGSVEDRVQALSLLSSYGSPQMPSPSCLGRQHFPSLAGGGFTNVGNEDTAKINRYQAASPANKPASHWLLVMSLSG